MKKYYLIIFIISLIAVWPFFKNGFYKSHDGEWMIIRFTAFHQTLVAGQFPVRFVDRLNNNYGYPVINFLYPLPFYISEIPKLLGFNFVDSIKITFISSTIFSALAMFWSLSRIFSKYASFAGSIVYLFIPYRFVDLYVRGSLGENVAFAIAPLILGSLFMISKRKHVYLPLLSISIALLITSHNVIAALFMPIFIIIAFLLSKKDIYKIISFSILGVFISAFFWLPALYDLQFVKLSNIEISTISDHVASLGKLIIPGWGFGSMPQGINSFSPQVGLVSVGVLFAAAYIYLKYKRKNQFIEVILILYATAFFLMTEYSLIIWQSIPVIDVIQFPWRLLSVIVFTSALLTAFVVDSVKSKKSIVALLIIIASILSTVVYTKPMEFIIRGEGFYTTNEDSTTVRDEYLPIWVKEKPLNRADEKIVKKEQITLDNFYIKPGHYKGNIKAQEDTFVEVNTIYFPGHQVKVSGKKVAITYENKFGLINFKLPKGNHEVIISYSRTPVHLISEIISVLSVTVAGIYAFFIWRKQNS